jgi:hypothetical protein
MSVTLQEEEGGKILVVLRAVPQSNKVSNSKYADGKTLTCGPAGLTSTPC